MEKLKDLVEERKIKALRNLREGDRVEVTYTPDGNSLMLPVTKCFYFANWKVFEKIIMVSDAKLGDRICLQNLTHPFTTLPLGYITGIQKLIPTR